ncbi:hypothetical protein EDC04DRAFT_2508646, partial [Pisolithus marmoratus]
MRFVRRSTTIPVPRVYATIPLRYPDSAYIFMDRVDGQSLDIQTWLSLDDPARDRIVAQLRNYVSQLRSLEPPPGALIGSVTGQPVSDDRLAQDEQAEVSGPYADEAEMNLALRRQHDLSEFPPSVIESHTRSHPWI